jgi:polysaccharide deacetylase family protein (PEP-CTERM system associated)
MTHQHDDCPGIALTIDVEDYFQVSGFEDIVPRTRWESFESRVERNTHRVLDILAGARVSATFFVLGWIAERYPALVRRIHTSGHEIGCHSYEHRLVYRCAPETFREDTHRAKAILETIIGEPIIGYRAPSFSITRKSLWALNILAEQGFEYDSSIFPVIRDRYGIPGAPRFPFRIARTGDPGLIEIPPCTIRFLGVNLPLGGGGYLRLFPESLFRRAIDHIVNVERQMAVLYVHPWELDPDQPVVSNGSWLSTFRQYVNLGKTEARLRRLLGAFPSVAIRTVLPSLTQETVALAAGDSPGADAPAPRAHGRQGVQ